MSSQRQVLGERSKSFGPEGSDEGKLCKMIRGIVTKSDGPIRLTDNMRADASQLQERSHQRVVDLFPSLLSSKRINEHQQFVGARGT